MELSSCVVQVSRDIMSLCEPGKEASSTAVSSTEILVNIKHENEELTSSVSYSNILIVINIYWINVD